MVIIFFPLCGHKRVPRLYGYRMLVDIEDMNEFSMEIVFNYYLQI